MTDIKVLMASTGGIAQSYLIHGQDAINVVIGLLTIAYLIKKLRKKNV